MITFFPFSFFFFGMRTLRGLTFFTYIYIHHACMQCRRARYSFFSHATLCKSSGHFFDPESTPHAERISDGLTRDSYPGGPGEVRWKEGFVCTLGSHCGSLDGTTSCERFGSGCRVDVLWEFIILQERGEDQLSSYTQIYMGGGRFMRTKPPRGPGAKRANVIRGVSKPNPNPHAAINAVHGQNY